MFKPINSMKLRRIKSLLFFLFLIFSITTKAKIPQRIISLAPVITKNIYLLHGENSLVGCTSFCKLKNPEDAQIVASAIQVNIEKVIMLKPDLIIASSLTNPETIKIFNKLNIDVLYFPLQKSFGDICSDFQTLGKRLGKKELSDQIVAKAKNDVEKIMGKIPKNVSAPEIFFQIGANPLFSVIPNTFQEDFIDFAGGKNIAKNLTIGSITREKVIVSNPDIIFISTMGMVGLEEKKRWETYKNVKAVKNKKIFFIDQEKTCSPTPDLFVEALNEIIYDVYYKNNKF